MAKGIGELPAKSPAAILSALDFPATRDDIVETACDSEAPAEVINFLKCLPEGRYASVEAALRDFAEAERRFGASNQPAGGTDRRNLGRPAGEDAQRSAATRHP